ncbi:hypothetical protein MMAGJ_52910 [Mycolicibacterium mageritense]|uniref:Uncharacterized protein n=2 Tax=Mycolicibacterium mageritense TaxID=53462 RepID=A0ABM7HZH2_MYCME|nr:hypothetical protein MMAGJ_52910 [Mycolicibacterium mageritense]GJJ17636.1 hypothetical protein MTY414_13090 [Mycolicibacterium mageritense]
MKSKPDRQHDRIMGTNWISRLAENLRRVYDPVDGVAEWDADERRIRSELEAIRVRFPDHA